MKTGKRISQFLLLPFSTLELPVDSLGRLDDLSNLVFGEDDPFSGTNGLSLHR
jgi:hypothetical protein